MTQSILTEAKSMGFVASVQPEQAKKFYGETLGLKFLNEDQYGTMYSVSKSLTLRVQKVKELKPQPFTIFGWQVDDIEIAVNSLVERGVKFEVFGFPGQDKRGICTFKNGAKVAWFKDPDGNTLSIAQIDERRCSLREQSGSFCLGGVFLGQLFAERTTTKK